MNDKREGGAILWGEKVPGRSFDPGTDEPADKLRVFRQSSSARRNRS